MSILKKYPYLFPLLPLLLILSLLYYLVIYSRHLLYKWEILKRYEFSTPIISIGSLEVGGSGKTPITIHIAQKFIEWGYRVAVISRGYKRKGEELETIQNYDNWQLYGDEPTMILRRVPEIDVYVSQDRISAIKYALSQKGYDLFLLDDGAQYRKLVKCVEILLLRGKSKLPLPIGELRDGYFLIDRDHIILWKGTDNKMNRDNFQSKFELTPSMYVDKDFNGVDNDITLGKKIFAFAGIAYPEEFKQQLLPYDLVGFQSFPDHKDYTQNDVTQIIDIARKNNADLILTTEKDIVKLATFDFDIPLYALRTIPIIENEEEFFKHLKEKIEGNR